MFFASFGQEKGLGSMSDMTSRNAWNHGADLATKREKRRLEFFNSSVPVELD